MPRSGSRPARARSPNGVQFPDGAGLLHEPRLGHGSGARRGGRRRLRRLQSRGGGARRSRFGWSKVDAATICAARTQGAVGQLVRVLGPEPDGLADATELAGAGGGAAAPRGQAALRRAAEPRAAGRSDGRHVAAGRPCCASTAATPTRRPGPRPGSTPPRSGCSPSSTGACPLRTYIRTRAWSDEQLDAAEARLSERGLLADGALHGRGQGAARVGRGGDRRPVRRSSSTRSGTRFDELLAILSPWGDAIRAAGGVPAAGPARPGPGPLTLSRAVGARCRRRA